MDAAILVSALGLVVATIGGSVALYNARKSVLWKRAELANSHLKELLTNDELLFACRCLDWNGGILVVPESLRPLLKDPGETITHDVGVYATAMDPYLTLAEMAAEPRLQIYRTATDTLLGWLSATDSAIDRKLYTPADIREAGYWLGRVHRVPAVMAFIDAFGYREPLDRLARQFGIDPPPLVTRAGGS
ncbi:hypothetical protein MZO42_14550 [Sphingomonas psychrotolerans]|uniref:Uncharacterized protein n=1 Tax=Sphingomonas psychrotolerans TaxID=1327635 RepID=A0ABU3N5W9_9SPHN|nr:hypothetical protein [Sphingomonas psychrotolerans]MDT8759919.1 hypothetical protein [Sphingomonas psychrotolerans]